LAEEITVMFSAWQGQYFDIVIAQIKFSDLWRDESFRRKGIVLFIYNVCLTPMFLADSLAVARQVQ
jgi:hypothetical protein